VTFDEECKAKGLDPAYVRRVAYRIANAERIDAMNFHGTIDISDFLPNEGRDYRNNYDAIFGKKGFPE
jgi:hypothetical protein